jgi:hypothetical protein
MNHEILVHGMGTISSSYSELFRSFLLHNDQHSDFLVLHSPSYRLAERLCQADQNSVPLATDRLKAKLPSCISLARFHIAKCQSVFTLLKRIIYTP